MLLWTVSEFVLLVWKQLGLCVWNLAVFRSLRKFAKSAGYRHQSILDVVQIYVLALLIPMPLILLDACFRACHLMWIPSYLIAPSCVPQMEVFLHPIARSLAALSFPQMSQQQPLNMRLPQRVLMAALAQLIRLTVNKFVRRGHLCLVVAHQHAQPPVNLLLGPQLAQLFAKLGLEMFPKGAWKRAVQLCQNRQHPLHSAPRTTDPDLCSILYLRNVRVRRLLHRAILLDLHLDVPPYPCRHTR